MRQLYAILNNNDHDFQADLAAVNRIAAVESILEVVCRTTGMGFAAVARVTEDRWIACAVRDEINFGLQPGGELQIQTTICNEIRQSGKAVIIDHVSEDRFYANHHTPAMYGFQSYISVPIKLRNGRFFGTLCAIDPRPARISSIEVTAMFHLFAELIAQHLSTMEQLDVFESRLREERKESELREQFIAILGHDLRNPINATLNSAQLLLRMPLEGNARKLASIVQDAAYRMKGLVENIMDFASGRLGGGINLDRNQHADIATILQQIIAEQKMIWPGRTIEYKAIIETPVAVDEKRMAQLFSNLLANALMHGKTDKAVVIEANRTDNEFRLLIKNGTDKIPDAVMQKLFQPFSKGEGESRQKGLGLGLFIASEIAKAHGGRIDVSTSGDEIIFEFRMPA